MYTTQQSLATDPMYIYQDNMWSDNWYVIGVSLALKGAFDLGKYQGSTFADHRSSEQSQDLGRHSQAPRFELKLIPLPISQLFGELSEWSSPRKN